MSWDEIKMALTKTRASYRQFITTMEDLKSTEPIGKNKSGKSYDKFVPIPWSHKEK